MQKIQKIFFERKATNENIKTSSIQLFFHENLDSNVRTVSRSVMSCLEKNSSTFEKWNENLNFILSNKIFLNDISQ